ncbi:MAG: outer membrane protein assembly factor BamA [Verrucomicrobiota bacterium]
MIFLNSLKRRAARATALPALFAGVLLFLTAHYASGQDGATVQAIDVQYVGNQTVSPERIRSQMSTKVGDSLSLAQIDEDIKQLYASGDVDNVRMLSENVAGGVRLIVVVQSRAVYGGSEFRGNTLISTAKLEKKVDLRVNRPIDESALVTARQEMQELYRKKGFPEATVNYSIQPPDDRGYSMVLFTFDEGNQGILRNVEFIGNESFPSTRLKEEMEQKEKGLRTVFGNNGATDPQSLALDVQAIEDFYRDQGFLNAEVTNVSRVRADSKFVDVIITIDEGDTFEVNSLSIVGVTSLSLQDDVLPFLQTRAGDRFAGAKLKDDIKFIGDQYGRRGYIEARVIPRLEEAPGQSVKVVLDITEGSSYRVGRVHIEGNEKTNDPVIRRELPIEPGQEFDTTLIPVTKQRLENMNYFESVEIQPIDTSYTSAGEKDILVRVVEKPTGSVNFGAGFSSIDSVTGFFELTQANFDIGDWSDFTGAGQRFRFSARVGNERRDISVSFTEPWFLGKRLALTTEGYYRDSLFLSDQFDQTNIGGAVSLRRSLGEFTYGSVEYRGERIEVNPEGGASPFFLAEGGDFFKSSVSVSVTRDTRDNLFLPRRGHKISMGYEFAGLGGDVDDNIFTATGSQYFLLPRDTIFSLRGKFASSSNGDHVFTRHWLGGANDLRAFDFRDVGPRDAASLEVVGGNQAWFGSAEVTTPLIEKIRGALFYDIGEVTDAPAGTVGGGLHSDWGVGLRLFILGNAPVKLDYAFPLENDIFVDDDGGRFQFTMGATF